MVSASLIYLALSTTTSKTTVSKSKVIPLYKVSGRTEIIG